MTLFTEENMYAFEKNTIEIYDLKKQKKNQAL